MNHHHGASARLIFQPIENESVHAFYNSHNNIIVVDGHKLTKLVADKSDQAKNIGLDLGDLDLV